MLMESILYLKWCTILYVYKPIITMLDYNIIFKLKIKSHINQSVLDPHIYYWTLIYLYQFMKTQI